MRKSLRWQLPHLIARKCTFMLRPARRLGQITEGSRGQDMVRQAEEWMNGQTICDLTRMTALLVPGWNAN